LASLSGHWKAVTCVSYNAFSDRAATGSNDRTIRLWNLRQAANNVALRAHTAAICAVVISPDARQIFSCARDMGLGVWGVDDTPEGGGSWEPSHGYSRMRMMRKLVKKPGAVVLCMSLAPDGRYLATGHADGVLELMRRDDLSVDHRVLAHAHNTNTTGGGVVSVAFSHDSNRLATCGGDRVALIFEVMYVSNSPRSRGIHGKRAGICHTLSLTRTLALWPSPFQRLHCVEWSKTGDELAVGCEDGVTYLYHMTLARLWRDLRGHKLRVNSIWLAPHFSYK